MNRIIYIIIFIDQVSEVDKKMKNLKKAVSEVFSMAGIDVNGDRDWDLIVKDERFFKTVFKGMSMALGESYMDGLWDTKRLDLFFEKLYRADMEFSRLSWKTRYYYLKAKFFNMQKMTRAFEIGEKHYDIGNDLYRVMLGPRMVYSSLYYEQEDYTVEQAENAKLELICKKLGLKAGMKILDIGCGWGALGKYAAEKYGVETVGITVSKEQAELARKICEGLPVKILLQDYRKIQEKNFDHVVSIGMIGHVGQKNYRKLMETAYNCLKDSGLFLIHTMGANRSSTAAEPWIDRYIFPHGMAPSIKQIGESIENLFVMEDWHNFSVDYYKTAMDWFENFNNNWFKLKSKYSDRFYRMWKYYLLGMGAAFSARTLQTWDIVLSRQGGRGKYFSIRDSHVI